MSKTKAVDVLLRAAASLEKVANYFDQEEVAAQEKNAAQLKSELLEPISQALDIKDPSMREKLAAVDPDVLRFLKISVATKQDNAQEDHSLGGPTEKIASESDDALLAFCMSDD